MTIKYTQVPQTPQGPSWDWNQNSAVRRQQSTASNLPIYAF